jgi:glutamyl-tRNA reductase
VKALALGLNWKTPVRLREKLAVDDLGLAERLGDLVRRWPGTEFVMLSTCNRTELYAVWSDGPRFLTEAIPDELPVGAGATDGVPESIKLEVRHPEVEELRVWLAGLAGESLAVMNEHLYCHEDVSAARHLFTVAAGLDSLILGEPQIQGQVRSAYQAACDRGTASANAHGLFQRAAAVAKRIHAETGLSRGKLSIAGGAIEYLRGTFESFRDKTVLVIGAGKMAELTLTHLAELQPARILVSNRTMARAEELAGRFHGQTRPFGDLPAALAEADIVISGTGAEEPIIRAAAFPAIMKARRHRLMAIIDIAVPRDFDPEIGEIDNVLLWNIDDLEKIRHRTLKARQKELDAALAIIDVETEGFLADSQIRQSGPLISRLERVYDDIIRQELDRLLPQLNGIPEDSKEKIRVFAHRLKNKLLHPPKTALRADAKAGGAHGLMDAVRRLFGLEE